MVTPTETQAATLRDKIGKLLTNRVGTAVEILVAALVLIFYLTPLIILFAWLSLWLRRIGWRDVGLGRPSRWMSTVVLGLVIGILWPFLDIFVIEQFLESLTGTQVDLSLLERIRGDPTTYFITLGIVWTWAAFGEEMFFRGYLLNRLSNLLGGSKAGWTTAVIIVSVCFGLAHAYQGITGILETAYVAAILGFIYLATHRNLWLPIIVHGVYDTVGVTLIFMDLYPSF